MEKDRLSVKSPYLNTEPAAAQAQATLAKRAGFFYTGEKA
jgi:hypothetical protein